MTRGELIKHLHEALNSVDITFSYRYVLVEAIEALSMPPLPSDLNEVVITQMEEDGDLDHFVRKGVYEIALKYARLGAEWMAGQGITLEGRASRRYENGLAGFVSWILFDQQKAAHLLVNQGEEADVIINIRKK